jgi:histidine triad (HIT) family protein
MDGPAMECIFCKIINGAIPAHIVYNDERVIAILDHRPVRTGHAMVLPKQHFDQFIGLPDDLAAHIISIGNKLGNRIMKVLEPRPIRIGFVVHGQLPHAHYHVIPQHDDDDITSKRYASIRSGQIVFDAENVRLADDGQQRRVANLLRIG